MFIEVFEVVEVIKCARCKNPFPITEFYIRKNGTPVSECKTCMKLRNHGKTTNNNDYLIPRTKTEIIAIKYLHSRRIPAIPGKAIRHSHVDVVAFGCIDIEVKYAKLKMTKGVEKFTFVVTPDQQENGFRGNVIMLICDYQDGIISHHFFYPDNPVFYIDGRLKSGFTFTPGDEEARKHGGNRVVMTQNMMDEAEDKIILIENSLEEFRNNLEKGIV